MEMLKAPLRMSLAENRAALQSQHTEQMVREREGDFEGNRHERRLAARRARRERSAEKETQ